MTKEETVETITRAYEEKIVELNSQHEKEIDLVKENAEKEKQVAIQEIEEKHRKELADFILGRKQIQELEKEQKKKNRTMKNPFLTKP